MRDLRPERLSGQTARASVAVVASIFLAACAGVSPGGANSGTSDAKPAPTTAGTVIQLARTDSGADRTVICLEPIRPRSGPRGDAYFLQHGLAALCTAYGRGEISGETYRAALGDFAALALSAYASGALRGAFASVPNGDAKTAELRALARRTTGAQVLCQLATGTDRHDDKAPSLGPSWCDSGD